MRRLFIRWLTRPARVPRSLRAALAVVLSAMAILGFAAQSAGQGGGGGVSAAPGAGSPGRGGSSPGKRSSNPRSIPIAAPRTKDPFPPGPGNPTKSFPSSPQLIAEGHHLYDGSCSSCHGLALQGTRGVAPALRGVGPGPVDFYLSTGRMPLEQPREEPIRNRPEFRRQEIDALIAYVSSFGGPRAPTADPSKGDISFGMHEFTMNCAGCHQVVARGGMTVGGQVPNLEEATAQEIAEAVRMGPYIMPHFDYHQIDQHELDSIARYVLWTRRPSNKGGWGIYNIGPIPEGLVTWWIALAALVLTIRLIGERTA